jgi:hypothetical protein
MAGETSFGGFLKQSTAVTLKLGPAVDAADGGTKETALTITQAEVLLTKNGSVLTQKNEATSATHDAGGVYGVPLDATDTNTLGILGVYLSDTAVAHRPFMTNFMVVPANIYDAWFGADKQEVDITQVGGAAVSTASAQLGVNVVSLTAGAINAAAIAADAIDADAIAADFSTEVAAAVVAALQDRIDSGAVVAGGASTVTLGASASATNNVYKIVIVISAAGVVQVAEVTGYVGATKVATVAPSWDTVPDTNYQYIAIGA